MPPTRRHRGATPSSRVYVMTRTCVQVMLVKPSEPTSNFLYGTCLCSHGGVGCNECSYPQEFSTPSCTRGNGVSFRASVSIRSLHSRTKLSMQRWLCVCDLFCCAGLTPLQPLASRRDTTAAVRHQRLKQHPLTAAIADSEADIGKTPDKGSTID